MRRLLIGDAFTSQKGYDVLQRICDRAGGRVIGTKENEQAMDMLRQDLDSLGYSSYSEGFKFPGWSRGADMVLMTAPSRRQLLAVALGDVDSIPAFEADVFWAAHGREHDFDSLCMLGGIALVTQQHPAGEESPLRSETIRYAAGCGARAVLFISDRDNERLLMGMTSFHGEPAPIPAFSITMEEGERLHRLLDGGNHVTVRIEVRSHCLELSSANVLCALPGKTAEKIVIGAHFDSWDLGQGAIDNGIGSAILFDVARILKSHAPLNRRGIEFVWFNGEEMGLWGAKRYVERHKSEPIVAMVNMDMTGSPTGFNAMGIDSLVPFLENLRTGLPGFDLKQKTMNTPWTNSDHQSFFVAGIPTVTLLARLDENMVKDYHSFGDTFDKVNRKYLAEAAAVISVLAYELANTTEAALSRRTDTETITWLREHNLEERLKRQGEWPITEQAGSGAGH